MSYVRAAANLLIDNAHADGMLTKHGIGRDWEASEPREEAYGWSADVGGQYAWVYGDRLEYVDKLKAIGPIRTYTRADMDLDDWTLSARAGSSQWRLSGLAAHSRYRMLHMHDGAIGQYGTGHITKAVSTSTSLGPNLQFWLWRGGRPARETDPTLVAIHLVPAENGIAYALVFPREQAGGQYHTDLTGITDAQQTGPFLMARPYNEALWTVIDRKSGGGSAKAGAVGSESKLELIRIEYDDGFLLVRSGERDKGWAFGGKWVSQAGVTQTFSLAPCQVEVRVLGHTAMFGMAELTAPTGLVARPSPYLVVTDDYNATPAYKAIAATPAGTSVTIAAEAKAGDAHATRPAVTFASSGGNRALLYCVQEYRTATVGSAASSPIDTNGNAQFKLMGLSGRVSPTYRGSTLSAQVRALPGDDLGDLPPNMKLTAVVGGVSSALTVFTGYVAPPQKTLRPGARDSGTHHAVIGGTLEAADYVEARLSRKDMLWHSSYEGWTEGAAFTHVLNRAGVPASLISVSAACTGILPSATQRGARRFKFNPDATVTQALDSIASAYGRRWGVDRLGVIFLIPAYAHVSGHYDIEIDYLTTDPTLVQNSLVSTRTVDDFRNFLQVMVGEGPDAVAKVLQDTDSMWTPGYSTFVGDVWSKFQAYPDCTDIDTIATELWKKIGYWQHHIKFQLTDRPLIMPDDELLLTQPASVVPAGSIFRVLGKDWEIREDGRYSQTLEAVRVE